MRLTTFTSTVLVASVVEARSTLSPRQAQPQQQLIDVHHHFVPDFYAEAVDAAGGDPSGWPVPSWNISFDDAFSASLNITARILSLTSPGAPITGVNETTRALARRTNEFCASLQEAQPSRVGCFAALPDLLDTNGTLAEIAHALDELNADGVTLFTRYGDGNYYLGNPLFDPIWEELNARKAVVFIHPAAPVDHTLVNRFMLQPLIDYPQETTRTAIDLITVRNRQRFPDTKVILSHAGGNLPWQFTRFAYSRRGVDVSLIADNVTWNQAVSDLRSFYYDLALSSSPEKLDLLLDLIPHDHLLYGSDFPYAPIAGVTNFYQALDEYSFNSSEVRDQVFFGNALDLLPRLANAINSTSN
ncbi:hypothetical protein PV10_04487 [Exophiala mesophila]|uniref:6-methylsalicylate decarboxylase n=1 Tax=Exophiala mesophila TaxID=212818 RepID=A0A0D1XYD3_EXOME|nr:uncharacterized protein PV10_04487 [Exophiala mesophila]KIV93261.1 hypothetical protein PV10_04487 [Exophiala mesophila]